MSPIGAALRVCLALVLIAASLPMVVAGGLEGAILGAVFQAMGIVILVLTSGHAR